MLIHGAGDRAWHWHLVGAELRERGHDVVAVDLPCEDESAGLEYADTVVEAIGDRGDLVVVAHSLAGSRRRSCAPGAGRPAGAGGGMVPAPGEPGEDWWTNTG